jgi:hypothetical protein
MYNGNLHTFANTHNAGLGAGYPACGATVQGISVGYSDIYDLSLEGRTSRSTMFAMATIILFLSLILRIIPRPGSQQ